MFSFRIVGDRGPEGEEALLHRCTWKNSC